MISPVNEIGCVNGLAWTSVGGELLQAEVAAMEGAGKIELTGSLGDVMKESAHIAVSLVRRIADQYGIEKDFYKTKDIHIHFPEGATPKDGPSAGVTIVTALVSALTGIPVRREVAMTGEISLRGKVMPIGGLKEKSMAAYRAGIKTVIIPKENQPDLSEFDKAVLEALNFVPVERIEEVLKAALTGRFRCRTSPLTGSAGICTSHHGRNAPQACDYRLLKERAHEFSKCSVRSILRVVSTNTAV